MYIKIRFLFVLILILTLVSEIQAQSVFQNNIGFENGNFDGWVGYQWRYSDKVPSINTSPALVSLPTSRRHVIITDQSAYDSNTGGKLKMIPEGYKYSARLGCEIVSSDSNPRCWQQSLQYTMKVDSSNAFLLLKYACVLQYSTSHDNITEMEPRFQLNLLDDKGDSISTCVNYQVYSESNIEGFQTYSGNSGGSTANATVKWRDWTTVGADLTTYIGQEITIEFLSADCTGQYHYGYAYFVVDCMPLYITVDYCTGDSYAVLEGPEGFDSYQWLDKDSATVIGNEQDLLLEDPEEGVKYYCVMESETGCEVILSSDVVKYEPKADFSWKMVDCLSNEVEFINNSTTNKGTLSYSWDLGDTTISEESFTHKFDSSGMHNVSLIVYNPPSGCTDTLNQVVESFSPPLVGFSGDTTYCPGLETELNAYGAYSYEWSTGSTDETATFGSPGGTYWMIGYSTPEEGCVSDKIYFTISEESDWPFTIDGDSVLCTGDTVTLQAAGAVSYSWNQGDTVDFIDVYKGGTYSVTGQNARGCEKSVSLNVEEIHKPDLDFSVTPTLINRRKNAVDCSAESNVEVDFEWDLGDGTISSSPQLTHYYSVTSELISIPVTISATNESGCYTLKSTVIDVEPFVPNVFTPNNDGTNDLFMTGFDLKVFDRHSILLYSGEAGWDGYYKGQLMDPDTYFYQLTYFNADGVQKIKKGFVTLVR